MPPANIFKNQTVIVHAEVVLIHLKIDKIFLQNFCRNSRRLYDVTAYDQVMCYYIVNS